MYRVHPEEGAHSPLFAVQIRTFTLPSGVFLIAMHVYGTQQICQIPQQKYNANFIFGWKVPINLFVFLKVITGKYNRYCLSPLHMVSPTCGIPYGTSTISLLHVVSPCGTSTISLLYVVSPCGTSTITVYYTWYLPVVPVL